MNIIIEKKGKKFLRDLSILRGYMTEDQTPFEKASSQIREALDLLKKQDVEAGLQEDFYKSFPVMVSRPELYFSELNGDTHRMYVKVKE
jgi:hypothetical protein